MKNILIVKIILVLLFSFSHEVLGQKYSKAVWGRYSCGYNDGNQKYSGNLITSSICTDTFGNVYNIGYLNGSHFSFDTSIVKIGKSKAFINKFNSNGDRLWTKTIEASNINVIINISKIKSDDNGNLYICGSANSMNDSVYLFPNWYKINNGFIAKFDSNWTNLWCKTVDGNYIYNSNVHFTDLDISGYLYVCGNASYGSFNFDIWNQKNPQTSNAFVAAINPYSGKVVRATLIDTNSVNTVYSIKVDKYTNCIIVGEAISSKSGYLRTGSDSIKIINNTSNSYILKMVNVFRPIWLKKVTTYFNGNGVSSNELSCLKHISLDENKNIYVAGNSNGDSCLIDNLKYVNNKSFNNSYKQDFYVIKLDMEGNSVWIKGFGSKGMDLITDMIGDKKGNLVLSCGSDANSTEGIIIGGDTIKQRYGGLIKLNTQGNVIFIKNLQEYRYPKALAFGPINSFYVTGTGINFNNTYDSIAIKYCEHPMGTPSDYNSYLVKFIDNIPSNYSNTNFLVNSKIQIYPNPSQNQLQIDFNNTIYNQANITVYDIQGIQCINKKIPFMNLIDIDLHNLNAGIYLIEIKLDNMTPLIYKVIKL